MNKTLPLVFILFISICIGHANPSTFEPEDLKFGEAFNFKDNNVQFMIYKNGEFDFFIQPRDFVAERFHLNKKNYSYNAGYDYKYFTFHDDFGAIVQIKNLPIAYDDYGRISKIGDTQIFYKNNRVSKIGGLSVYYYTSGKFKTHSGYINHDNKQQNYFPYFRSFTKPTFENCIVSSLPYRKSYTVKKYKSAFTAEYPIVKKTVPERIKPTVVAYSRSYSNRNNSSTNRNTRSNSRYSTSRAATKKSNESTPTRKSVSLSNAVNIFTVEKAPSFIKCSNKRESYKRNCQATEMSNYFIDNFNTNIKGNLKSGINDFRVLILIDSNGRSRAAKIVGNWDGGVKNEIRRVVRSMPKMIPGKYKNKVVPVKYSFKFSVVK